MHTDLEGYGYDWNMGEADHEGEMVVSQLHRIHDMSKMLLDIVGEDDEFPAWTQYKLGRAYDDLTAFFSYIESMSHVPYDPDGMMDADIDSVALPLDEARKRKKKRKKKASPSGPQGLWHNIRKRREQGKPRLKRGQKGFPKTLKIED